MATVRSVHPYIQDSFDEGSDDGEAVLGCSRIIFDAMRAAVRLRYDLSPYIYGAAREAYDTGISMCRPLYYEYPEDSQAYDFTQEYLFGNDILATVVCEPADSVTGLAERVMWFRRAVTGMMSPLERSSKAARWTL